MSLSLKNLHVMLVEDIIPMRELTVSVLKEQGVGRISFAPDGQKAFEDFCHLQPDIIFTDWQMPVMNGMDFVKLVRTSPRSPNRAIPIIMMTGYGSPLRISEARNAGVTEFLMKPFSATDLNKRLLYVIKNPRDFIIAENYAGPDRRRKKDDSFEGSNSRTNPNGYKEKIPANKMLQSKVGLGMMDNNLLVRSQKLMDENKFDFTPIAQMFLQFLWEGIKLCRSEASPNRRSIERLIDPVMQIKANARIFKMTLVGDLASIMLNFLENMNELDADSIQIVEAHHRTLTHIINSKMYGDGGETGKAFETELENACQRYVNSRIARQKAKLQETIIAKQVAS